ncbi:hypothetical protein Tco_0063526 [Tanacetum coccineum]
MCIDQSGAELLVGVEPPLINSLNSLVNYIESQFSTSFKSMAQVLMSGVKEGSAIVAEVSVLVMGDGGAESVPEILKDRLVFLLGREIVEDIRNVGEYRRMSHELKQSVRTYGVFIAELKVLGDCGDGNESLGLLEHLQLECIEKGVRLRLMMKET